MMNYLHSWLLLERTDELDKRLYQVGENPDPYRLFDNTELAAYKEQSPLLISVQGNPSLEAAFTHCPNDWPGIRLESLQPREPLLQHLRHILFVGFDGGRKGVLRYSIPSTASYFFPALDPSDVLGWLGPIQKISWYGKTWRDRAQNSETWKSVVNPGAEGWQTKTDLKPFQIESNLKHALQQQNIEKFLYGWWQQQSEISFDEALSYLNEGMRSSFASSDALTQYLNIRSSHRGKEPPALPTNGSDSERLSYLQTQLESIANNKEGYV